MKNLFRCYVFCWLAFIPRLGDALGISECMDIHDNDDRAYCIAKINKNPSECYSILSPSLRSKCLLDSKK